MSGAPDVPSSSTTGPYETLEELLKTARKVFLVGLPGTGKSLYVRQLVRLARSHGMTVSLLQWDVARTAFEDSPHAIATYPAENGVTHPMVRIAVGTWAREAVLTWHTANRTSNSILIGEIPLVGNRLVELARPDSDRVEAVLQATDCQFLLPVPDSTVRAYIESERMRRLRNPEHERELKDAPLHVLTGIWEELAHACRANGIAGPNLEPGPHPHYEEETYRAGFLHMLRHRQTTVLPVHTVFETAGVSAHELDGAGSELTPLASDVARAFANSEALYPTATDLEHRVNSWFF